MTKKKINNFHDVFNVLFDILDDMREAELKGKGNKDANKSMIEFYLRQAFKIAYNSTKKDDNNK